VALETSAFIYLLEKIEKGSHVLIASEALIYENSKSPDEQRKVRVASYFNLAREFVGADFSDEERVEPPRAEAHGASTCFVEPAFAEAASRRQAEPPEANPTTLV
jgi:hypothetical protein